MFLKLKLLFIGTSFLTASLAAPALGSFNLFGQSCDNVNNSSVCTQANNQKTETTDPVTRIIKGIASVIAYVTGIAAIILVIISGIMFVTAGGDAGKVARARSTLTYAIVGLVVSIVAYGVVKFVIDKVIS